MNIAERYGVELPRQALKRLLRERLGVDAADKLLAELHQAEQRYTRAVRVNDARRRLAHVAGDPARRAERWAKYGALVEQAERYIETGKLS